MWRPPRHALVLVVLAGCAQAGTGPGYETLPQSAHRDSLTAQRFNAQGLKAVEATDLETASEAFRRALEADLWYAPAHNNLGLTLLHEGRAYEAAWEFHYAAKLMPGSVSATNNLGLVMERVGRLDEAIELYHDALKISPENIEVMGHLARAYVKAGHQDRSLEDLLKELTLRGSDGWDLWARQHLIRLGR